MDKYYLKNDVFEKIKNQENIKLNIKKKINEDSNEDSNTRKSPSSYVLHLEDLSPGPFQKRNIWASCLGMGTSKYLSWCVRM